MEHISSNEAYIIKRINELWGVRPSKNTVQRIIFLIEQKGIDVGYDYGLHFYGVYSKALDMEIRSLCADGIVDLDYSGHAHKCAKCAEREMEGQMHEKTKANGRGMVSAWKTPPHSA